MVNIISLPQETQKLVLEYLDPNVRSSDKRDLYHCTQVCKLWYDIGVRILHQRFWLYISAPPSPDDAIRRYFTAPHISFMRELRVLITAGGRQYTTRQQCTEVIEYLQNIISMISSANNLQLTELDLFVFTPGDCTPDLWPFLRPANEHFVTLVRTIASKQPEIHIRLSRPEIMAETQVETTSHPVFDAVIDAAKGRFRSLSIGCRLSWLLKWIRDNPQLQEIYYTKMRAESHEIEECWDVMRLCQLDKLMLDGFEFPPVQKIPMGLTELILTHLDDTITATNAVLTHLPNLRVLSLRLERRRNQVTGTTPQCVAGEKIVSRRLRKVWWTRSLAPDGTVTMVNQTCKMLDSLSPPRNVTDQDLVVMSDSAVWLSEVWMMDCPNITETGFRALKNLRRLKYLQIHTHFTTFLREEFMTDFLQHCNTLSQLTIVFDGATDETTRREELLATVPGTDEYHTILSHAMSFQSSTLGDRIIFDIKFIRNNLL
jgi:hypothetical protein